MNSYNLTSRITIQQRGAGQDAAGQPVQTWVDVATVWANIRYLSGVETIKSDAPVSVAKASICIRRRTDISAGMRVVFGSAVFNIQAVLPDEGRRVFMYLACETGGNQG